MGSCKGGGDKGRGCLRWRGIGSWGISSRSIWQDFVEGMVGLGELCREGSPSWKDCNYLLDVLEYHSSILEKLVIERLWEREGGRFIFDKKKNMSH